MVEGEKTSTNEVNRLNGFLEEFVQSVIEKHSDQEITVILYGSAAHGANNSDIDILVILDQTDDKRKGEVAKLSINLHKKYGFEPDFEVPYTSKIIYDQNDCESAFSAKCFDFTGNKFLISDVIKYPEMLESPAIKQRLLLNALTTNPNLVVGSQERLALYTNRAWNTLIPVVFSFVDNVPLTPEEFLELIIENPYTGAVEDSYLGYKSNEFTRTTLLVQISSKFHQLHETGKLLTIGDAYTASCKFISPLIEKYFDHE